MGTNAITFTDQQDDVNANRGLYYLRARHYDPALGRFLSKDPLPGGNRYTYVGNNPISFVDPWGACSVFVGSQPIKAFGGKLSKIAIHTYIVTADPLTGEKLAFEGEADGGLSGAHIFGKLRAVNPKFGDASAARDFRENGAYLYYEDAGSCDSINSDFIATKDLINAGDNDYHFLSQNSNSVVSTLLGHAGLPSQSPDWRAFGWGTTLRLGPPQDLPWWYLPVLPPIGVPGF